MTGGAWDDQVVDQETFDRLFAESVGPYLLIYIQLFLDEQGTDLDPISVLEDLFVGFLASGALIHSGTSRTFSTRLYGLAESALPHLGRPALRDPLDPSFHERARRFAGHTQEQWHAPFDDYLSRMRRASPEDRRVILLRDFHRLTMQEIGQRLGMEMGVARAFVTAARERMATPQGVLDPTAE